MQEEILVCQRCLRPGPTKPVHLSQNIGAVIMRFTKNVEGRLCKDCIREVYWPFSLTTLVLGWWGVISLFVTPFYLVRNTIAYVASLSMDPPSGASRRVMS